MRTVLFFLFTLIHASLSAAPQDAITLEVGVKTLAFHDDQRSKILITEVFYPAENDAQNEKTTTDIFDRIKEARDSPLLKTDKKFPLIVVSHDQRGDRFSLAWLCTVLAAHGYIVASIDHFGSTWSNRNPEIAIQRWNRAEEISFLISAMLKDPLFGPHLNETKIGMIGYSLGALTGVWLAGGIASKYQKPNLATSNPIELEEGLTEETLYHLDISPAKKSHLDPRIRSFLLLAPVYGSAFDKSGLFGIKAPVLIIAAENDKVAPPSENAVPFNEWIPAASYLLLGKRAGHSIFLNKPVGEETVSLVDRRELHKTIVKETLKFFDQTL